MARADLLLDIARLAFMTAVAIYALGVVELAVVRQARVPLLFIPASWFALLGSIAWLMAVPSV